MIKGTQWFMERMAERIVPVITRAFTNTIQTMDALGRAEQQSQLEEAARRYEADGQAAVAESLRRKALELDSTNPASASVEIFENLASDQPRMLPPTDAGSTPRLPPKKRKAASRPGTSRRISESDDE